MPLSEYEQRMLEQMERQLHTADPKLVDTMGAKRATRSKVLVGVIVLVVGVGLLLTGAVTQLPWLGVIGFIAMFVGVWQAVYAPRRSGPTAVPGSPSSRGPAPRTAGRRTFMQRMEDRWERRRRGR